MRERGREGGRIRIMCDGFRVTEGRLEGKIEGRKKRWKVGRREWMN